MTSISRGFFYLRHFMIVSKNLKPLSSSNDARSLSSLVMASPIPNSSCSEPDDAIVPPKVMVHLIVDQTDDSKPAKYYLQDCLWYWTWSLSYLPVSTGSSSYDMSTENVKSEGLGCLTLYRGKVFALLKFGLGTFSLWSKELFLGLGGAYLNNPAKGESSMSCSCWY